MELGVSAKRNHPSLPPSYPTKYLYILWNHPYLMMPRPSTTTIYTCCYYFYGTNSPTSPAVDMETNGAPPTFVLIKAKNGCALGSTYICTCNLQKSRERIHFLPTYASTTKHTINAKCIGSLYADRCGARGKQLSKAETKKTPTNYIISTMLRREHPVSVTLPSFSIMLRMEYFISVILQPFPSTTYPSPANCVTPPTSKHQHQCRKRQPKVTTARHYNYLRNTKARIGTVSVCTFTIFIGHPPTVW